MDSTGFLLSRNRGKILDEDEPREDYTKEFDFSYFLKNFMCNISCFHVLKILFCAQKSLQ